MRPVTDLDVLAQMRSMGGSFVQALANAFACADQSNRTRLKETFPEIWNQYKSYAEQTIRQDEPSNEP